MSYNTVAGVMVVGILVGLAWGVLEYVIQHRRGRRG